MCAGMGEGVSSMSSEGFFKLEPFQTVKTFRWLKISCKEYEGAGQYRNSRNIICGEQKNVPWGLRRWLSKVTEVRSPGGRGEIARSFGKIGGIYSRGPKDSGWKFIVRV